MKQARTLRIYQIVCILLTLYFFRVIHMLPGLEGQSAMTPLKWIILALALYSAAGGFYMQKRLLRTPRDPRIAARSTPAKRWMVANVVRLAFATAVSLYGLVLHFNGGPESLVVLLIALGLILLLIWRPGPVPTEEQ
jgi:hypothetical protein